MAVDMTKLTDGNGLLYGLKGLKAQIVALLGNKVDKVSGKGLSTNDYTTADKKKLDAFGAADTYATHTYVSQQIAAAGHITKTIVKSLPAVSDAKNNVIYMVKKASGTSGNLYDEYMLIDGALEKVGDTETKISTLSNADVEEILGQI